MHQRRAQGSVIGPALMNLFMRYCFDAGMQRERLRLSCASYRSFCSAYRPCRPHCRFAVMRTENDREIESG